MSNARNNLQSELLLAIMIVILIIGMVVDSISPRSPSTYAPDEASPASAERGRPQPLTG